MASPGSAFYIPPCSECHDLSPEPLLLPSLSQHSPRPGCHLLLPTLCVHLPTWGALLGLHWMVKLPRFKPCGQGIYPHPAYFLRPYTCTITLTSVGCGQQVPRGSGSKSHCTWDTVGGQQLLSPSFPRNTDTFQMADRQRPVPKASQLTLVSACSSLLPSGQRMGMVS